MIDGGLVGTAPGLEFGAVDKGGGVSAYSIAVNGQQIASKGYDCALVTANLAKQFVPCPSQVDENLTLDTTQAPWRTGPGNVVEVCVADFALEESANHGCAKRTLWVDNYCPASPIGGAHQLAAGFGTRLKSETTRYSHRRRMVKGTLLGASGNPIAGATVCTLTSVVGSGRVKGSATTTTGANGRFALQLRPGASRKVFVHYSAGGYVLAKHGLTAHARVRPTRWVRPGDERIARRQLRFRGILPGPRCRDRIVKLQAKVGKRRWQAFRTVRSGKECKFRARYKLRDTTKRTRYVFRVTVPEQPRYPYLKGRSRQVERVAGPR